MPRLMIFSLVSIWLPKSPSPEEIEAYKPYLTRQIEIINLKIIVPLGRFSMNYFLPEAKIDNANSEL